MDNFSRIVMKFGSVRGIGAAQVLRDFGELWSTFSGSTIFDSGHLIHFCCNATKFGMVRGLAN